MTQPPSGIRFIGWAVGCHRLKSPMRTTLLACGAWQKKSTMWSVRGAEFPRRGTVGLGMEDAGFNGRRRSGFPFAPAQCLEAWREALDHFRQQVVRVGRVAGRMRLDLDPARIAQNEREGAPDEFQAPDQGGRGCPGQAALQRLEKSGPDCRPLGARHLLGLRIWLRHNAANQAGYGVVL